MSMNVQQKIAEEALNTNDHDLQRATTWALNKTTELAKLAQEAKEKAEQEAQEALRIAKSKVHNFHDDNGTLLSDWKIQVVVKQFFGDRDYVGTVIEPVATSARYLKYNVTPGQGNENLVKLFIHNYSESNLTIHGRYKTPGKEEEILDAILIDRYRDASKPADDRELWYPVAFEPGTGGDQFVLVDKRNNTSTDVLRIYLSPQ
jgi:hypothetical protein